MNQDHVVKQTLAQDCQTSLSLPLSIPRTIWLLSWATFFLNISFLMVYGLSTVYLKSVLGMGTVGIGFLAGLAEAFCYAAKLLSGVSSDFFKKRKPLVLIGVVFVILSRPLFAFFPTIFMASLARFMERWGNGIQATPFEAWVADFSPKEKLGACYGLKKTLGMAGAFFGAFLSAALMYNTHNDFRIVFAFASFPALIAFFILIKGIKDIPFLSKEPVSFFSFKTLYHFPKIYWLFMGTVFFVMMARTVETFIVLHAHGNLCVNETYIPFIFVLSYAAYALSSYPIGKLSDEVGRFKLLGLGIILLIISNILLAFSTTFSELLVGVFFWGLQMGIVQSLFVIQIADLTPKHLCGTSFGLFYLITSLSMVLAGVFYGYVIEIWQETIVFYVSGIFAFIGLVWLIFLKLSGTLKQ